MREFVAWAVMVLKLGVVAGVAVSLAVEVFHAIEHLPTAVAWIGVCFAMIGCSIGALIAQHENRLDG